MDLPIYQWLRTEEYAFWVCPHMEHLLTELAKHGSIVQAVGLVNYKAPEAVVFLSGSLPEHVASCVAKVNPALQLHHNGMGALHSVE